MEQPLCPLLLQRVDHPFFFLPRGLGLFMQTRFSRVCLSISEPSISSQLSYSLLCHLFPPSPQKSNKQRLELKQQWESNSCFQSGNRSEEGLPVVAGMTGDTGSLHLSLSLQSEQIPKAQCYRQLLPAASKKKGQVTGLISVSSGNILPVLLAISSPARHSPPPGQGPTPPRLGNSCSPTNPKFSVYSFIHSTIKHFPSISWVPDVVPACWRNFSPSRGTGSQR